MSEYSENWITTYTGKKLHYLKPTFDEIDIEDIAHALSLKCRFSGHCKVFYSVGEHSLRVANLLPDDLKLSGLLHDAAEAYIPDIPRPIKEKFKLRQFEEGILKVIKEKFGTSEDSKIKEADNILLATEARDLMPNMDGWAKLPEPLYYPITPLSPIVAKMFFLIRFREYGGCYGSREF